MSQIREFHTRWDGVGGAPFWTTVRQTAVGVKTAQQFATAWGDFLDRAKTSLANQLTATVLSEVTIIESTTGELVGTTNVTQRTIAGTDANDMLPRTSQLLIRWHTPLIIGGRRVRGRTFLPGLCEENNSDAGSPLPAIVTGFQGSLNTLITDWGGEAVVYSRTHLSGAAIDSASVWTEWASLRSRRD